MRSARELYVVTNPLFEDGELERLNGGVLDPTAVRKASTCQTLSIGGLERMHRHHRLSEAGTGDQGQQEGFASADPAWPARQ